jgi:hypothetical protein
MHIVSQASEMISINLALKIQASNRGVDLIKIHIQPLFYVKLNPFCTQLFVFNLEQNGPYSRLTDHPALVGLGRYFSFVIYTQSVGLLGRGIS